MGDKTTDNLIRSLEQYQEIADRHKKLQERMSRAAVEKESVREDIYQRVYGEYQRDLAKLAEEFKPLEAEFTKARNDISNQLSASDSKIRDIQDKIEELAFRHRVGEYSENHFSKLASPLKKNVEDFSQESDELRKKLDQIEQLFSNTGHLSAKPADLPRPDAPHTVAPPKTHAPQPKSSHGRAKAPATEATPQAAKTAAKAEVAMSTSNHPRDRVVAGKVEPAQGDSERSEDVVNPSDWMKEFEQEDLQDSRETSKSKTETSVKHQADPLSSLADPSVESTDPGRPSTKPRAEGGVTTASKPTGFPVMIIVKGPGAGKKLPLVPMSMSLGREHDNNIELKDEEVARYHARISFQRGQYTLEDLESSSGTWVNDEKIKAATLKHGDKIRVGTTELMVDFE
ncbi:MAG: FHA domain-containing protein [Candidatus Krumholzibacteria bacterium]|nr:FHA domain-containing protein [Candidatus Krumholzibacteria bacterium]